MFRYRLKKKLNACFQLLQYLPKNKSVHSHSLRGSEVVATDLEKMEKEMDEIQTLYQSLRVQCCFMMRNRETLIKFAVENFGNEAAIQWLKENSGSQCFFKLMDVFDLIHEHISQAEKQNHSDYVDVTILAHGSIGLPLIPASCLLPLPNITDVLLYSPWNCVIHADAAYGIATGLIKSQHRVFYCMKTRAGRRLETKYRPIELPDLWNSLKAAGDQRIPTVRLSSLTPPHVGTLDPFESLRQKHGPPGRNRILIPFVVPGQNSVPFSVVTLALSLVLVSSRFKANVHLCACLRDQTGELKVHQDHLRQQYAYAVDGVGMKVSDDMFDKIRVKPSLAGS